MQALIDLSTIEWPTTSSGNVKVVQWSGEKADADERPSTSPHTLIAAPLPALSAAALLLLLLLPTVAAPSLPDALAVLLLLLLQAATVEAPMEDPAPSKAPPNEKVAAPAAAAGGASNSEASFPLPLCVILEGACTAG